MSSELLLWMVPAWLALGAGVQGVVLLLGERPPGVLIARLAGLAALASAVAAGIVYGPQWQFDAAQVQAGKAAVAGTSLSIAATANLALVALLHWGRRRRDESQRPVILFLELLCLAAALTAVVAGDLWLVLAGLSVAGWTGAIRSVPTDANEPAVRQVAQAVAVGFAADALIAAALITFGAVGLPLILEELDRGDLFPSLDRFQQAYWGLAAYMLLAGLMIRCALFPLAFWVKGIVHFPRDAAWLCGILLPLGGWTFLRAAPLWGATTELHDFLINVGVLGALLVGLIGAVGPDSGRMISYAAAAQLGLLWAGEGMASRHPSPAIGFFVAGTIVFPLIVLLSEPCGRNEDSVGDRARSSPAHWSVLSLAIVWGCGLFGQEWLFNEAWSGMFVEGGELDAARGIPPIVVAALPSAHLLIGFAMARAVWLPGHVTEAEPKSAAIPVHWLGPVLASVFVAGVAAGSSWFLSPTEELTAIPAVMPISMLLGFAIAHLWEQSSPVAKAWAERRLGGVLRMCQREFYAEEVLRYVFVTPWRVLGRLCEIAEQVVFERGVVTFTRQLIDDVDSLSREIEEDAPRRSWKVMLIVVVVLLASVVFAR